ncbi:hypothetical protein [Marinagarivorans cellulosilyticus]|uniref:Uncharacterized protein n=1 Tax=Marinagarivorans cellulosilyticus TaxID=2721545 RepID=A0AAN2BK66_9GAMM|nr:hypothetical protein [Marinagarivorans cellulosilyticus]BCD97681.1 hypothetical protein MARGE09_P1882 [Marinagarivorans cellulosilyticus]
MVETTLLKVDEASAPMFCDAFIGDEGDFVFGSFWGNETVLLEFFARLTLPASEFGIRELNLSSNSRERFRLSIPKSADLKKITARTPPNTILGPLCHVFIFDAVLHSPNRTTGEAYVFGLPDQSRMETMNRMWNQVQDLSQVPVLEHWRDYLMPILLEREWVVEIECFAVTAFKISLCIELFEQLITDGLRSGKLSLTPLVNQAVNNQPKESLALF